MKKFILSAAGAILIGLIIVTVIYHQNVNEVTYPQLGQLNKGQDNQNSQNNLEQPRSEQLQPINRNDTITYTLQNNELNITFNKGKDWIKVPVEKDLLFEGEYNGSEQELIENSYVLTEERAAFLYSKGPSWDQKGILVTYSLDQGKTWVTTVVTKPFPAMRFRKIDFLNDQFGYIILSGDRTMSQEYSIVYLTHDGGKTWKATKQPPTTRLIASGGFVDETTGFLSYGTINPEEPNVYVTQDGGETWAHAVFHIPKKYDQIFVQAEVPVKEKSHLAVVVNQGPNGDYAGGEVKGKFISEDNGKTWEFSKEVQPNETAYQ
ncbi:oxidoreductase [Virgibacillus phasianinus]|uniref:Oxidoreductase n=1 Tax=Virgibacillus phasianinus TaxID=2017483 RepID=A0A220U866_9BACI|nr:sialidase family protein [Virgibacillus phasianinus]ASK64086.1 oxidoreductase [Virgibacillus phasianinus]